jgi:hypothetical protein
VVEVEQVELEEMVQDLEVLVFIGTMEGMV